MERLTKRTKTLESVGIKYSPKYDDNYFEILNKLGEYEDAEEHGLILRLPVPEGAVVYTLSYIYECKFDYDCKEFDAYKCEEDIPCKHQYKVYRVKATKFQKQMLAMFGKTVFLTKEEAESALVRMEKENE